MAHRSEKTYEKENRKVYIRIIAVYLAVCLISALVSNFAFNASLKNKNISQMSSIASTCASHMNDSINLLFNDIIQLAEIFSDDPEFDYDKEGHILNIAASEMEYTNVGILDMEGHVHGNDVADMYLRETFDDETIKYFIDAEELTISPLYRSHLTGMLCVTVFYPLYVQNEKKGEVFLSYPVSQIMKLVRAGCANYDAEAYILDSTTGNYIACAESSTEGETIGARRNIRLLGDVKLGEYDSMVQWLEFINSGSQSGTFTLHQNGADYYLAYNSLDVKDGWYIVLKIKDDSMTNINHTYVSYAVLTFIIILIATIGTAFVLVIFERNRRKVFQQMSGIDITTGGMNRLAYRKNVDMYIDGMGKDEMYAMVYMDLDGFKQINDEYGHYAGDAVLREFYSTISRAADKNAFAGRLGGDEFAIFIKDVDGRVKINRMMERMQRAVENIHLDDYPDIKVAFSAGIAMYPEDGLSIDVIKQCADEALYEVKNSGKNSFRWYES